MRYILALFSGTSLLSKYRQTGCRQSHDINIQRTLIAPCTLDGKLQGTYETWESPPVQKFSATEPRNLWFNFFWYFNISQSILKHTSLQLRFWNSRYARKFWRKFRDSNPSAITSHGPKHQLTKKTSTLGTSATTPQRFTKNPPPPPPPEFSASKCQGGRDGAKAKILIARWQESLNHLFANVQGGCVTFFLGYLKGWLVNV